MVSKAVFFDRDGTISVEAGYSDNVSDFKLYPSTAVALSNLKSIGFKLVVVTNQSGVARGFFPESRVQEINDRMHALLKSDGITLDGIYYCPHLPDGVIAEYSFECSCRKPGTGMIKQAETDLALNLKQSFLIGDKLSDITCGINAGMKTILVRTGYGRDEERLLSSRPAGEHPDDIVDTLKDAANWIKNETI